jgi:hypothetical protein
VTGEEERGKKGSGWVGVSHVVEKKGREGRGVPLTED